MREEDDSGKTVPVFVTLEGELVRKVWSIFYFRVQAVFAHLHTTTGSLVLIATLRSCFILCIVGLRPKAFRAVISSASGYFGIFILLCVCASTKPHSYYAAQRDEAILAAAGIRGALSIYTLDHVYKCEPPYQASRFDAGFGRCFVH